MKLHENETSFHNAGTKVLKKKNTFAPRDPESLSPYGVGNGPLPEKKEEDNE